MTTTKTNKANGHLYVISYSLEGEAAAERIGVFTSLIKAQACAVWQIARASAAHLTGRLFIAENVATANNEDADYYAVINKDNGAVEYYGTPDEREDVDYFAGCYTRKGYNVSVEAYSTERINSLPF